MWSKLCSKQSKSKYMNMKSKKYCEYIGKEIKDLKKNILVIMIKKG